MAASTGAAIAAFGGRRGLRPLFGSPVRSWRTGLVVYGVLVATTWSAEALFADGEDFQYLFSFIVTWFCGLVWAGAGALVVLARWLGRRWPVIEQIVNVLVATTAFLGAALWVWVLVVFTLAA
jgi:hypothetical protein